MILLFLLCFWSLKFEHTEMLDGKREKNNRQKCQALMKKKKKNVEKMRRRLSPEYTLNSYISFIYIRNIKNRNEEYGKVGSDPE